MDVGVALSKEQPASAYEVASFSAWYGMTLCDITEIDAQDSTEIMLSASSFSYGYSFEGITRSISATILITHVLIVLIHTILIVCSRWCYPDIGSIYDIIILIIKSTNSAGMSTETLSLGVSEIKKRNVTLMIREEKDSLKLVLDGSSEVANGFDDKLLTFTDETQEHADFVTLVSSTNPSSTMTSTV
jgi:hypothetical protein